MKFGLMIMARGPGGSGVGLGAMARAAEAGGLNFLACNDPVVGPRSISSKYPYSNNGEWPGAATGDCLEMATVASFLAATTDNIGLLTSVMVVPHRPVVLAAKMLATVDVLSGGRLTIGIGAGWMREEFEALGLPPFEERGAVTDEYIRAFKVLWTEDDPHFEGKYISFDDISILPKPAQKPHPPIWVGGESRPALRRTAELADGWYPLGSNPTFPMGTPEQLKAGLARLAQYAERFGRDPSTIETIYRTHQFELKKEAAGSNRLPFVGDADQIAGDIRQYQEMGVTSMIWDFLRQTDDLDQMLGLMEDFATKVWPKV